MKIIYKYLITDTSPCAYADMPKNFKLLKLAYQGDSLFAWCEVPFVYVDEHDVPDLVKVYFDIVPTGDLISSKYSGRTYLDTVFHPDGFVFHVYRI